jgi:hypothetical protein
MMLVMDGGLIVDRCCQQDGKCPARPGTNYLWEEQPLRSSDRLQVCNQTGNFKFDEAQQGLPVKRKPHLSSTRGSWFKYLSLKI